MGEQGRHCPPALLVCHDIIPWRCQGSPPPCSSDGLQVHSVIRGGGCPTDPAGMNTEPRQLSPPQPQFGKDRLELPPERVIGHGFAGWQPSPRQGGEEELL